MKAMHGQRTPGREPCQVCGKAFPEIFPPPRHVIGGVLHCDRCANLHIAEITGLPALPEPPSAETFVGPDGQSHLLCYRFLRCPNGILAEAEEFSHDGGCILHGYRFEVFAEGQDVDLRPLVGELREQAAHEIARTFLTERSGRLLLEGTEIEGRLVWDDDHEVGSGVPYAVAVDGRKLTWEDLGRALEPYEGWHFKLSIIESSHQPGRQAGVEWWEDLNWTQDDS